MTEYMKSVFIGVLVTLGGVSGIVYLIFKYSADIIVSRFHKKYEVKLQKETHIFEAKHSALQDLSKTIFSLFDVIVKCTKEYENDSNKKPTESKCLEIKKMIRGAKTTIYGAIPIFGDNFTKPLEKIHECLNDQYERLCYGIDGLVPYTSAIMESKRKDFSDNIANLGNSIYSL